jgi:hypothetical protein
MLTKRDISEPGSYQRAPQVDRPEIRLLWHADYWDGPLSGVLLYHGERCWFEVVEEGDSDADGWFRRCVILRLSTAQLAEEERWHELFRAKVGTHTDYDAEGRKHTDGVRPRELWHEFYEPYGKRSKPAYLENEVLGWFDA